METTEAELERVTLRKVALRLLPFMVLLYIFNYLDRVNVTVAVLRMRADLHLSEQQYAFGYGIFFIGYFLFEIPSNVLLQRLGARKWIARIVFTWGFIACCMVFIRDSTTFYILRFLLGIAEAGFFPGVMLYLTYWFPAASRGRASSRFVISGVIANIIGGPIGAGLLGMDGLLHLRGWQWLFLVEGIPSVLMGFAVLTYLTDRPERAHWLQPAERDWLVRKLAAEEQHQRKYHHVTLLQALGYPRVRHLAILFFLNIFGSAGLGVFTNLVLKQRAAQLSAPWSDQQVLWLNTLPVFLSGVALLLSGMHSDRTQERRGHVVVGISIAAVGTLLCATTQNAWLTLAALCIVAVGGQIANGPFWALTTGFLTGEAAAGGIALINSVGNSGSFFGPMAMGYLKDHTHNYTLGMVLMAAVLVGAALTAYLLPPDPAHEARRKQLQEAETAPGSAPLDQPVT